MNERGTARHILAFGVYQCDLSSSELHKNGIKVKLSGQPFRLLTILLERPGEVVTRGELEERLWPGQPEIDLGDNLNTAVNKIRSALEDRAENPRFIETLPRLGYRFIAQVENHNGNDNRSPLPVAQFSSAPHSDVAHRAVVAETPAQEPMGNVRDRVRSGLQTWVFAAIAVPVGLFAFWWFTPLPAPHVVRTDQITFSARIDTPIRPASDGEHVYYIQRAGDHWDLMQTHLGGGDGRRIEAHGRNGMVFDVSSDHKQLLVGSFTKRDGLNELWWLPSEGSSAMRLGDGIASDAVFSPDGQQILYARGHVLLLMDGHGLHERKLADLPDNAAWLAWSPDGERLRFTMGTAGDYPGDSIWEISKTGTGLRQLQLKPAEASSACCGSWTPDGKYYIFTVSQGGQSNTWAVRERGSLWHRSPRGPFQLTFGPSTASGTAGRDGAHIFYYAGVWRQEMERWESRSRGFLPLSTAANAVQVSYSRDGNWIAYIDPETRALLRSRADGSERLQLATSDLHAAFPQWSPDGKWIVFGGDPGGQLRIFIVPTAGGQVQLLLNMEMRDADWSSDGAQIVASHSLRDNGSESSELITVDVVSKRIEKIQGSEQLAMSRWSPDGRYISATSVDQSRLELWDVSRKEWRVIAHGDALGISVWSPDAHYLYFQDLLGPGERLYRYDVKTRRTDTVVEFSDFLKSGMARCALFAVTPDGSPIVGFSRSAYDLLAAEVTFP